MVHVLLGGAVPPTQYPGHCESNVQEGPFSLHFLHTVVLELAEEELCVIAALNSVLDFSCS